MNDCELSESRNKLVIAFILTYPLDIARSPEHWANVGDPTKNKAVTNHRTPKERWPMNDRMQNELRGRIVAITAWESGNDAS
ncbi:MAG: hypothetical protein KDA81_22430 [Planctomycetaceae bacterium]|nr:hypothetical protein [Planctomycetaceae bacterium]